jgi:ubiquinone/menaquinone biosynthesis C-methylase UbiE
MKWALCYAVGIVSAAYVLYQARKPGRWVGRVLLRAMNEGHSRMTDWGLSHVGIRESFAILDVGCGGGRTIEKLAAVAKNGKVEGIDYADGSVAASRALNKESIKSGRVSIQKASVSRLPFADDTFDLVTAIETQYYWPDLPHDMREIWRVLKPSGTLVVIAETYKGGAQDRFKWPVMWLLRSSHLSASDQLELFEKVGYRGVQIFEEPKKGWICAMGRKADVSTAGSR